MMSADLEPVFGNDTHPGQELRQAEQHELFRIRATTLMADAKWVRNADPETLTWAIKWAKIAPLGRPLGTGEPK